jgi:hypothetical protein
MKLLILCSQWGHERLPLEDFFSRVKKAGYGGTDTSRPEGKNERKKVILLLDEYRLAIVGQQHQAKGNTINEYCKLLEYRLSYLLGRSPLLVQLLHLINQ